MKSRWWSAFEHYSEEAAVLEPAWLVQKKLKQVSGALLREPAKLFTVHDRLKDMRAVGLLSSYLDLPSASGMNARNPFWH